MLGDILRREREKQNLTVKDVEQETSIRALYIEAIENGDYKSLPGEVYAKGFIRNYAGFLKLDADAILQQYREENHPEEVQEVPAPETSAPVAQPRTKVSVPPRPAFSSGDDFKDRVEKSRNTQRYFAGMLAAVVLLGGAYFVLGSDGADSGDKPAVKTEQTTKSSGKTQKAEQPAEKKFDDVEVTGKFADRCWTKVVVDGKTVFEGTVEKGKTMDWKGTDKVVVTAGNAGAVSVTHNGNDLGKLGEDGQVVEKNFTKDTAEDVK